MTDLSLPVDEDDVLLCCLLVTILRAVSHLKLSEGNIVTSLTHPVPGTWSGQPPGPLCPPTGQGGSASPSFPKKNSGAHDFPCGHTTRALKS